MSSRYDTLYRKDVQSFRVEKGSEREVRYVIPYGSSVTLRVSATAPVLLTIAGPHMEQVELIGTREFKFTVDPGVDIVARFQGKTGLFAKASNITFEIEMYTLRDAIKVGEDIDNLLGVLKDLGKDYYVLNKEHVQETLKRMAVVWKFLDETTKSKAKELMNIAKKFESGVE